MKRKRDLFKTHSLLYKRMNGGTFAFRYFMVVSTLINMVWMGQHKRETYAQFDRLSDEIKSIKRMK